MIQFDNVSKSFPSGSLFSGVTLSIKKGVRVGLVGKNGSGKTTTLRMISTMMRPTSGSININGHDTAENDRLARKSIGFMTNQTALYDRLSPYEMVKYFADLNRMEKDIFEKRCRDIFDRLDMHTFANKRIGTLSSGMKQKTSIARTIIHDPDIIVFDEPTTGLDVMTSRAIIELIRNSKEEKKTIIFSSHRMEEVKTRHKLKILKSETKVTCAELKKSENKVYQTLKTTHFLIKFHVYLIIQAMPLPDHAHELITLQL